MVASRGERSGGKVGGDWVTVIRALERRFGTAPLHDAVQNPKSTPEESAVLEVEAFVDEAMQFEEVRLLEVRDGVFQGPFQGHFGNQNYEAREHIILGFDPFAGP